MFSVKNLNFWGWCGLRLEIFDMEQDRNMMNTGLLQHHKVTGLEKVQEKTTQYKLLSKNGEGISSQVFSNMFISCKTNSHYRLR